MTMAFKHFANVKLTIQWDILHSKFCNCKEINYNRFPTLINHYPRQTQKKQGRGGFMFESVSYQDTEIGTAYLCVIAYS